MPCCVVKWCKRRNQSSKKADGITYHLFPKQQLRHMKWVIAVRLERGEDDWIPSARSTVGSVHFADEDIYESHKGYRMLKKSAVPVCTMVDQMPSKPLLLEGYLSSEANNQPIQYVDSVEELASNIATTSNVNKVDSAHINNITFMNTDVQFQPPKHSAAETEHCYFQRETMKISYDNNQESFLESNLSAQSTLDDQIVQKQYHLNQEHLLKNQKDQHQRPSFNNRAHKHKRSVKCPNCTYEFNVQEDQTTEDFIPEKKQKFNEICNSNNAQTCSTPINIPSSDLESVFNTPKTHNLKRKLKHQSFLASKRLSKICNLQRKNNRLKKKCTTLKDILNELKKVGHDQSNIATTLGEFPEDLICNIKKTRTKRGRTVLKYTPTVKKFALTLNYYSPAAYKYVRRKLLACLPHPSTLSKWYQVIDGKPGFTEEAFRALKSKFEHTEAGENLVCLMADEMAIRQQKIFNGKDVDGLVTFGPADEMATQVYVLMLVALNGSFKLPLGYFFINGLAAEQRCNIITMCLQKCHDVNAEVVSFTFDGCASNFAMAKQLGCNFDDVENMTTHFAHPSSAKPVVVILDPCHMIKLVRNTFEAKKDIIDPNNDKVQWEHLTALKKLQDEIGLHFGNKLSERHLSFRNNVMNVKLATQTLSHSVATALNLCCNELKIPNFQNVNPTINFIDIINTLFDILNCRSLQGKGYKHPFFIDKKGELMTILENAKEYLLGLKIDVQKKNTRTVKGKKVTKCTTVQMPLTKTKSKTGFLGLLVCISSFKMLYEQLVEQRKILKYILPYKFSQDHLELFFGVIRNHGRCNNNPNTRQFTGIYKKTLLNLELSSKFTGNCVPLEDFPILNCSSVINRTSPGYRQEFEEVQIAETHQTSQCTEKSNCEIMSQMLENRQLPGTVDQIVGYIAGFVARKLTAKIQCPDCIELLLATEKLYYYKLICLKDFGGLSYPSVVLFKICHQSETILRQIIKINTNGKSLTRDCNLAVIVNQCFKKVIERTDIITALKKNHSETEHEHDTLLIKSITEEYLRTRLHYLAKKDSLLNSSRQKLNKLVIFRGT